MQTTHVSRLSIRARNSASRQSAKGKNERTASSFSSRIVQELHRRRTDINDEYKRQRSAVIPYR